MRRATTLLRVTAVAPVLVPVLVVLVACARGGGAVPDETAARSPSSTATPTDDSPPPNPAEAPPPFREGTGPGYADQAGAWDLVFTDVRVAEHEGFDRIVMDFDGTGTPGWSVDYVDEPALEGSGEAVPLDGDAFLDVYASGTTWPADDYYSGPRQFAPEAGGIVDDVYVGGTFEGYTQVLVGIDGDRAPFRVFALTDPVRLVVDVSEGEEANS